MAKIYLDELKFNNYIGKNLKNAIFSLREALTICSILDIPYDFDYRNYLKKFNDNIKLDLNVVNNLYNRIKDDCKKYNNINDNIDNYLNSIENYSISLRKSAIK